MPDTPGHTIRPIEVTDVEAARALMLRTVVEDFEDSYNPVVHADVDDIPGWYISPERPGPFLLVAQDDATGEVVATCGIRAGALKEGLSPQHLVDRYRDGRTGQLVRVYVSKDRRRRGIAEALVTTVLTRAAQEGHYDQVALHTFPHSPGALPFWLAMGAVVVEDDVEGISRALFLEIPFSSRVGTPA